MQAAPWLARREPGSPGQPAASSRRGRRRRARPARGAAGKGSFHGLEGALAKRLFAKGSPSQRLRQAASPEPLPREPAASPRRAPRPRRAARLLRLACRLAREEAARNPSRPREKRPSPRAQAQPAAGGTRTARLRPPEAARGREAPQGGLAKASEISGASVKSSSALPEAPAPEPWRSAKVKARLCGCSPLAPPPPRGAKGAFWPRSLRPALPPLEQARALGNERWRCLIITPFI